MKTFAVLQLSGCAGCEVALLDAEQVGRDRLQLCHRTSYRGEVKRANSLARISMAATMGTPRANESIK